MQRSFGLLIMDFCRDFGCLWIMFILGFLFCCLLATLAYFTYQTIFCHVTFCSLWIDVPGRLTLFLICYYVASMCGFLPLPRKYHLNSFIEPFIIWKLESWNCLFRNLCLPIWRKMQQRSSQPTQNGLEVPLLRENSREFVYDCLSPRSRSEPIVITSPRSYVTPQIATNPQIVPKIESPEIHTQSGSISSIDSSVGDIVVPIIQRKSSKRHYLSETSDKGSVSPDDPKIYAETKWSDEATENILVPVPDYAFTRTRGKRVKNFAFNKKPSTHIDDENTKAIRQKELQMLAVQKPKAQAENAVVFKSDGHVFSTYLGKRQLEEKSAALANCEKNSSTKHREKKNILNELVKMATLSEKINLFSENNLRNNETVIRKRKPPPEYRYPQPTYRNPPPAYRNPHPTYRNPHPTYRNPPPAYRKPPPAYSKPLPAYSKPPSAYSKPPPKYHKIEQIKEYPNIIETVLNDDAFASTKNALPQDGKYFAATHDEKPVVFRQTEQLKSVHERLKICSTYKGLRESTGKESFLQTNDQSTMHKKYQQLTRKIVSDKEKTPPKLNKTESQVIFSGTQARNTQLLIGRTDRSTVSFERESTARHPDSDAPLNFPRIPWQILRHRGKMPPMASAIHRRNVKLERFEMNQYLMNQKREDQVKLPRSVFVSLNNGIITETVLPRSCENINILGKSQFHFKSRDVVVEGKIEQAEATGTTRSDNVSQTKYHCDRIPRQEKEIVNIDNVSNRRHSLPSQIFQIKEEKSTRIQTEIEENVDFKFEMVKNRERTMSEPTDLTAFEHNDAERVDLLKPIMGETANEGFRRLRFENFKRMLMQIGNLQQKTKRPTPFESKVIFSQTEIKIMNTSDNKDTEADI